MLVSLPGGGQEGTISVGLMSSFLVLPFPPNLLENPDRLPPSFYRYLSPLHYVLPLLQRHVRSFQRCQTPHDLSSLLLFLSLVQRRSLQRRVFVDGSWEKSDLRRTQRLNSLGIPWSRGPGEGDFVGRRRSGRSGRSSGRVVELNVLPSSSLPPRDRYHG